MKKHQHYITIQSLQKVISNPHFLPTSLIFFYSEFNSKITHNDEVKMFLQNFEIKLCISDPVLNIYIFSSNQLSLGLSALITHLFGANIENYPTCIRLCFKQSQHSVGLIACWHILKK